MNLGEIIKQERIKHGDTQEVLAERLGVSRQTILNWEKGRTLPDSQSLAKLAVDYQLSFDELIGLKRRNRPSQNWKWHVLLLLILSVGMTTELLIPILFPALLVVLLVSLLIQELRLIK